MAEEKEKQVIVKKVWRPRHGQWVKFAHEVQGAYQARDGKTLGIYQRAYVDGLGQTVAEAIHPVGIDGFRRISRLNETGTGVEYAQIDPQTVEGLEPITHRDDLPDDRINHKLVENPDWHPVA